MGESEICLNMLGKDPIWGQGERERERKRDDKNETKFDLTCQVSQQQWAMVSRVQEAMVFLREEGDRTGADSGVAGHLVTSILSLNQETRPSAVGGVSISLEWDLHIWGNYGWSDDFKSGKITWLEKSSKIKGQEAQLSLILILEKY